MLCLIHFDLKLQGTYMYSLESLQYKFLFFTIWKTGISCNISCIVDISWWKTWKHSFVISVGDKIYPPASPFTLLSFISYNNKYFLLTLLTVLYSISTNLRFTFNSLEKNECKTLYFVRWCSSMIAWLDGSKCRKLKC